jgi:Mannosyl-glycoprotein endo-beta-N-acetylglucosaminidase
MPVRLMALEHAAQQAKVTDDATLRSAIVKVANYYLRMAAGKTPAEMEAVIWQHDSADGADHGASCAAFASLTLELGAQVVGGHSWVTGGGSYPWPLHRWADVRVEPNPASPGVTSILQDAEAHQRWHPVGDGYQPRPGDWVLFDGHVEVVTKYADGVLDTIGGDSVPNFSVNAHSYRAPLGGQGVVGFVNNGDPGGAAGGVQQSSAQGTGGSQAQDDAGVAMTAIPGLPAGGSTQRQPTQVPGLAAIPGMAASASRHAKFTPSVRGQRPEAPQWMSHRGQRRDLSQVAAAATAGVPGAYQSGPTARPPAAMADTAVIPGLPIMAQRLGGGATAPPAVRYSRHQPSPAIAPARGTQAQRAFISEVAPGAIAAQRKYGVPASVTIAQAIDESGWGQSGLATRDYNLFGIKGAGPAGSDAQPTSEYVNGQEVGTTASFRVYGSVAESIDDHGRLLATSGYYGQAMAHKQNPNAFASSLTGVYATDPTYGEQLIGLMREYDLYRYDMASGGAAGGPPAAATAGHGVPGQGTVAEGAAIPGTGAEGTAIPGTATASRVPPDRAASGNRDRRPATPGTAAAGAASRRAAAPGATAPGAESPTAATPDPEAGGSAAAGAASSGTARPGIAPSSTASSRPVPSKSLPSGPGSSTPVASSPAPSGTDSSRLAEPGGGGAGTASPGTAAIPGLGNGGQDPSAAPSPVVPAPRPAPEQTGQRGSAAAGSGAAPSTHSVSARHLHLPDGGLRRRGTARGARAQTVAYQRLVPPSVRNDFVSSARARLLQAEPLYLDVADHSGISWQLLAACDWMQCKARSRYSPVHGEKLGTVNADGTSYRTKSEALEQVADDLVQLARAVYRIDLTAKASMSVRELANAFAAFRWGGLLKLHRTSALEFPYSVAGLTDQHMKMRWPNIDDPNAPDKPGTRFRMPFGAVPVVLCLEYPATA